MTLDLCGVCAEEWQREAKGTGLTVVLFGRPVSPADVNLALARMEAGTTTPEPRGADLTWEAIERERGYDRLDDQWPDDGDGWKRGDQ